MPGTSRGSAKQRVNLGIEPDLLARLDAFREEKGLDRTWQMEQMQPPDHRSAQETKIYTVDY